MVSIETIFQNLVSNWGLFCDFGLYFGFFCHKTLNNNKRDKKYSTSIDIIIFPTFHFLVMFSPIFAHFACFVHFCFLFLSIFVCLCWILFFGLYFTSNWSLYGLYFSVFLVSIWSLWRQNSNIYHNYWQWEWYRRITQN